MEKTVNITNFIGVYDNYITKEECNKAIKLYEDQNKFNNTVNRIGSEQSSILQKQDYGIPFYFTCLKIQKTLPTEGYHVWHIEHGKGFDNEPRAFVFSIYLNDVEDGGETEFLHFSKRVKPKTGRIVIWPAGFPYVHRGNPPLSGETYILTSWMMIR
jgi:hypothetical protein